MFREVSVTEVWEVLRAWLSGSGLRKVAAQAGVDRKTARRYVAAAEAAGLARDGGLGQLSDELVGAVVAAVRPDRPQGYGVTWEALQANHDRIEKWVGKGLTVVKIGDLLAREGVLVPQRTLHRYCVARTDYRGRQDTVLVADGSGGGCWCAPIWIGCRRSAMGSWSLIMSASGPPIKRSLIPTMWRRRNCCTVTK